MNIMDIKRPIIVITTVLIILVHLDALSFRQKQTATVYSWHTETSAMHTGNCRSKVFPPKHAKAYI